MKSYESKKIFDLLGRISIDITNPLSIELNKISNIEIVRNNKSCIDSYELLQVYLQNV